MSIEREILLLAESSDGIVTRHQLMSAGWPSHVIDRRITSGLLVPTFRGVYRVTGFPENQRSSARAAYVWAREPSLLTGGTNLGLRGFEGFEEGPIEIYLPNGKSAPGIRKRRLRDELSSRPLDGMATTTIEQTLLDACAHHPAATVGKAMDEALRRRMTTVERLRSTIPTQSRGIRGVRVFARLVRGRDLDDLKVRSEMETRTLRILRRIKEHAFVPNFEVTGRAGRYLLDFALPQALLGIECHSRRFHGPQQVPADLARDRDLKRIGWLILYYSWDDIVFRPREVQKEIEECILGGVNRSESG